MQSPLLCRSCGSSIVDSRPLIDLDRLRYLHRFQTYVPPAQMHAYQQKLNDVLLDIKTLHTMIDQLEECAYQTRTLISPIRNIPNEILGLIFQEACSDPQPETRKFPLVLASVSARWRDVALGTPHIWTFIYACSRMNKMIPKADLTIPLYLERSRLIPITIDVASQSSELVSTLCSQAERWTDVLFNITPDCLASMYQSLDQMRMPHLTSLTLVDLVDKTGLPDNHTLKLFQDTPKLHMLCLGGPVIELEKHPLPYERISSLVLSWMSEPLGILRVISLCSSAYHISISDTFIEPDEHTSLPSVQTKAPFISFRLGRADPARIQFVLPHISAPCMFSLKLAPSDPLKQSQFVFSLTSIVDFVVRSGASLRRLEIAYVRVTDIALIRLLEATPQLTELYLTQQETAAPFITPHLVRRLTINRDDEILGVCDVPLIGGVKNILFNWLGRSRPLRKIDLIKMVESRAPSDIVDVVDVDGDVVSAPRSLRSATLRGFNQGGDDTLDEAEEVMERLARVQKFRMVYDPAMIRALTVEHVD